jgi:peptide/nickel transport system permease protein
MASQERLATAAASETAEDESTSATPASRSVLWWVARRIAVGVLIVWLVSVIVFVATRLLPSDAARSILGTSATPERVAALRREMGLDRPAIEQYWDWLTGVARGDLGNTLTGKRPVTEAIGRPLVNSLTMLGICAIIAIPISVLLGGLAAMRCDGALDRTLMGATFLSSAVPEFAIGVALILLFGTAVFHLFPGVAIFPASDLPIEHPDVLVLPVATLIVSVFPYLFRLVRASLIDILESDYVMMARMKSLPERLVFRRHALPNALVPTIQASASVMSYLLGGTIIVESLFRYPGLGSKLTEAINARDVPLIQGITLIFAGGVVVFNLLADVLSRAVSPRLRTSGR